MKTSESVFLIAITTLMITILDAQTMPKEAVMSARVTGPFDVKIIPQDDKLGDGISRMLLDKQYHGDLEGTSIGQMLAISAARNLRVFTSPSKLSPAPSAAKPAVFPCTTPAS